MENQESMSTLPLPTSVISPQKIYEPLLISEETKDGISKLAQRALAARDPFTLIEDGHLKITTKSATLEVFVLNRAQRRFLDRIKRLWVEKRIIRINLLKARQLGITTVIEAIIFSLTSYTENTNSLIIADDLDGSNYIFGMSKLYQEQMPEHLLVPEKRSNEKKLEFDGIHSQILIDTSANPAAGRKYTFRLVHLSEYAFFSNANLLMDGLSNSVPALPQTIIIKETTANGLNHFKEEWDAAANGDSDYVNIFLPWYLGDDYRMPVDANFVLGDRALGEVSADEKVLYNLLVAEDVDFIEERLQWRRWCIRNNCRGYVSIFRQEYPSTPAEAFVAEEKNVLITSLMLDGLKGLTIHEPKVKRIVSIDPSLGGDECVFYFIENGKKIEEKILHERDTMKIVGEAVIFMAQNKCDDVIVDCIGIGKGIADRMNELKKRVQYFNSAEKANKENDFANMRAEAYWYTMEQIRDKKIPEIKDTELCRQLTTVPFKIMNSKGKIILMVKEWIKKKLGRSPDRADTFVMGIWGLQSVEFWTPASINTKKDPYDVFGDNEPAPRNPMTA